MEKLPGSERGRARAAREVEKPSTAGGSAVVAAAPSNVIPMPVPPTAGPVPGQEPGEKVV
jgi:hypothetical protein